MAPIEKPSAEGTPPKKPTDEAASDSPRKFPRPVCVLRPIPFDPNKLPTREGFQDLLDDNHLHLQSLSECQRHGLLPEALVHQQMLHRNLVYMGKVLAVIDRLEAEQRARTAAKAAAKTAVEAVEASRSGRGGGGDRPRSPSADGRQTV